MISLVDKYSGLIPQSCVKSCYSQPPATIRVNTLKISRDELINRLTNKGFKLVEHKAHPQAIKIIKQPFSIGATTEYLCGYYFVQDAASMIPVTELNPRPGDLVLDMCSAPGGKTTHLAELMNDKGVIIACDVDKQRLKAVKYSTQRMGFSNVVIYNINPAKLPGSLEFDKVLLDAPCSAEGTLYKNPKALEKANYKQLIIEQQRLIETAIKLLKKGGMLVYSTCTINPEENELIVQHAVNQGMKLLKLETSAGSPGLTKFKGKELKPELSLTRRFYQLTDETSGFFVARMIK